MEEERKKKPKVISGAVERKKKTGFTESSISSVGKSVLTDVIIPKAKDLIAGIIQTTVDMLLFGESRGDGGYGITRGIGSEIVSYSSYYKTPSQRFVDTTRRDVYAYDDVIFNTRGEAEKVLLTLRQFIKQYTVVSVADLYDCVGIIAEPTDNHYGWTDLSMATIERVGGGRYKIAFPRLNAI